MVSEEIVESDADFVQAMQIRAMREREFPEVLYGRRNVGKSIVASPTRGTSIVASLPSGTSIVAPHASGTSIVASELFEILHRPTAKQQTFSAGKWRYGEAHTIDVSDLERHLKGEITLAFLPIRKKDERALFVALDIDENFPVRRAIVGEVLKEIGGGDLVSASFLTSGSSEGRGKVVITLAEPAPRSAAIALACDIQTRCLKRPSWGVYATADLTIAPQHGQGGVMRLGGRNGARNGPLEVFFNFDGEPLSIPTIRPFALAAESDALASQREDLHRHSSRLVSEPWTHLGHRELYRRVIAVAHDVIRCKGAGEEGKAKFHECIAAIRLNSPELAKPSPKTKDPRHPLDRMPASAWDAAVEQDHRLRPLNLTGDGIARGVKLVYAALVQFTLEKNLDHRCFSIDMGRLAEIVGRDKKTAWRWMKAAETAGVLVIHDRGSKHFPGAHGRATTMGLIYQNETVATLTSALKKSGRVFERSLPDQLAEIGLRYVPFVADGPDDPRIVGVSGWAAVGLFVAI